MSGSASIPADVPRTANPFSTRWVRPGALPYQFPPGVDAAALVAQLRQRDWRGSIVGPHGSGKTALLGTLVREIEHSGRTVRWISLRDGQRRLPGDFAWPRPEDPPGVIVVDGYEQLGWIARWKLKTRCRSIGWGLLVTAHSDAGAGGFPLLCRTAADLATVQRLIDRHLPPHGGLIQADDVAAAFRAQRGDVRETFFALYDLFEQRRRESAR